LAEDKQIAYIVSHFPCYTETFILNELLGLGQRNYRVKILSLKKPREKIEQEEAGAFCENTVYYPFIFGLGLWKAQVFFIAKDPRSYFTLIWEIVINCLGKPLVLLQNLAIVPKSAYFAFLMRNAGLRHIHAHFANFPATSAMIISRLLNVPFTFTCHAHDIFYDATMLDLKIKNSRACFAISEYNRNHVLNLYPALPKGKVKVIHCGVDLKKFTFLKQISSEQKLRIFSVGRLMPAKGFDDLILACGKLKKNGLNFSCQIVGEGPMEKGLRRLISRQGLEKEVILTGALCHADIIELFKQADVFVLASKKAAHRDVQDGIPIVLMEAMACGVPVISTNFSGIPELIEDKKNGFLVASNDFNGLAEAVFNLSSHKDKLAEISANARRKVEEEFNIVKTVDKLCEYFI